MSDLTNALDRMLNWLRQYKLSDISLLQPGLSNVEIDKLIENVPLQLPQDIRELYQWKNGTKIVGDHANFSCIFETWAFYPLDIVIDAYKHTLKLYENTYTPMFGFDSVDALNIFFSVEPTNMGYIIFNDKVPEASVIIFQYCTGGDCYPIIKYASLTDMMLTIAEYYENAYYISNNGALTLDDKQALGIWRKYNSYRIKEKPNLLF
jgi:SMI1 / KNR4 family (SUKH-1)